MRSALTPLCLAAAILCSGAAQTGTGRLTGVVTGTDANATPMRRAVVTLDGPGRRRDDDH